ncbi:MAG: glycosyltransferase family 4 protein, partial [bacterium]
TMLEAMCSAKPIIVTESGGMPEIIRSDVNGYVIPKRNHEALAERIIQLLSDADLRDKLGQTGRKEVKELYSIEIYAAKAVKSYELALKNYAKGSKQRKEKSKKIMIGREELSF